jgi:hypothetical protein
MLGKIFVYPYRYRVKAHWPARELVFTAERPRVLPGGCGVITLLTKQQQSGWETSNARQVSPVSTTQCSAAGSKRSVGM